MIYTELTIKALKLCFEAHKGQSDKSGVPYVFHPFHLAEQMTDEDSVCAALLHDVVEDTEYTFENIVSEGFQESVVAALRLLTHDDNEPYMDYVMRIKNNRIAKAVKLADLAHNADLSRFAGREITERDLKRREKYLEAIKFLTQE